MADTVRKCTRCSIFKPLERFAKDKSRPLGVRYVCRVCYKTVDTKYRERRKLSTRVWRLENPDKVKKQQSDRYRNNPLKGKIEAAVRRKRSKQAMPKWANKRYMKLFYQIAQEESEKLGYKITIDHIIPLKHPLVCGLHNEFNLQFLSFSENSRKRNTFNIGA